MVRYDHTGVVGSLCKFQVWVGCEVIFRDGETNGV